MTAAVIENGFQNAAINGNITLPFKKCGILIPKWIYQMPVAQIRLQINKSEHLVLHVVISHAAFWSTANIRVYSRSKAKGD